MAAENYSVSRGMVDIIRAISRATSTYAQTVSDVLRVTNSKFKWAIPIVTWDQVSLLDAIDVENWSLRRIWRVRMDSLDVGTVDTMYVVTAFQNLKMFNFESSSHVVSN